MKTLPAALLGLTLLSAPTISAAQAAPSTPRQCFFARQMRNWADAGPDAIDVRISSREVYRLHLFAACPELKFALSIGVDTMGGSSSICEGDQIINLLVRSPGLGQIRCPVDAVRRLSPEETVASYQSRPR